MTRHIETVIQIWRCLRTWINRPSSLIPEIIGFIVGFIDGFRRAKNKTQTLEKDTQGGNDGEKFNGDI